MAADRGTGPNPQEQGLESPPEPAEGGEPVGIPSLVDVGSGVAAAFGHARTVARETAKLDPAPARFVRDLAPE
jgi:hypothetical protein